MLRRPARVGLAAALAALCVPAGAAAAPPLPSVRLPGDAVTARVQADGATWLVGARPGAAAARVARRHGARRVGGWDTGSYVVRRAEAGPLAAELRRLGLLVYAEPNALRRRRAMPVDPLDATNPWRQQIVDPALTPPPVTPGSPLIALVDATLDATHPEFADQHTTTLGGRPVTNTHGTATASVAAAPANGIGLSGVWPDARALNVPLDDNITCDESANGIYRAIKAGASVINMSYGSPQSCQTEYRAIQFAVAREIIPVAAAGNEFAQGNPLEFPASLPHVVTVAAVTPDNRPAFFSNANVAIDLAAPGVNIPTAVPVALDDDGTPDGYQLQSGTSFAAPMVSAALAWVRAARVDLRADQAADVVRFSARDVPPKAYDRFTGYGVLDLAKALTHPAGPHDPDEPNDDIAWVDGRMFGKPDSPIYRGTGRPARVDATLDAAEDPADVYRVKVRGRSQVTVTAKPSYGDVTLLALSPGARTITDKRHTVARSAHRGRRTERVTIVNRSSGARAFYVALEVASGRRLDAGYVLRAGR